MRDITEKQLDGFLYFRDCGQKHERGMARVAGESSILVYMHVFAQAIVLFYFLFCRWIRIVGRFIFGAKEEDVSSSATAAARPDEDSGRPDAHPDSDSISLGGVAEGLFLTSPIGNGNGTETEFENGNGIDSGPRAPRAPIVLSFEDLSLVVPLASGKKRRILKGVTGVAMPPEESGGASARGRGAGGAGSMFAILGPSGAGKSTLLGILSGRVPQGRVRANSEPSLLLFPTSIYEWPPAVHSRLFFLRSPHRRTWTFCRLSL